MTDRARNASRTWAITSFFPFDEPAGSERRLSVFRAFRERLRAPLAAVELSQDGEFQLRDSDADLVIQRKGGALLWQKERLLNIAVRALPAACDTVVWIDCDVILTREDWPEAVREALAEGDRLLQPFRHLYYLGEGETPERHAPFTAATSRESASAKYMRGDLPAEAFRNRGPLKDTPYAPGMAWAARRSTVEEHGLYDAMIMGSADKAMFSAACGRAADVPGAYEMGPRQAEHFLSWGERFHEAIGGRVGFIEGEAYHLWHGELATRGYWRRYTGFDQFELDPEADLRLSDEDVWVWNSDKPALHTEVREWFELRKGRYDR